MDASVLHQIDTILTSLARMCYTSCTYGGTVMSITLSAPPAVVAERQSRRDGAEKLKDFFLSEEGWFGDDVRFDRELANER